MANEFIGEPWRLPHSAEELQNAVENQVPRINASGHWECWDISTGAWVDTGVVAGGGISSWNGRTGEVVPVATDYPPAFIGAAKDSDLAPVEVTSTASQAYAVNSFLVYNGQLYRVTAEIEIGDTLTAGTNIEAADVGTYLAMVANSGIGAYALGGGVITDLDDAKTTGWVKATSSVANRPVGPSSSGMCRVEARQANSVIQTYIDYLGYMAQRYFNSNAWTAWEYINPPLTVGYEYRTTERYNGKPVYAKLVAWDSTIPSAGGYVSTTSAGVTNFDIPVSIDGYITTNDATYSKIALPCNWRFTGNKDLILECGLATNRIILWNKTAAGTQGIPTVTGANFLIKYTKTTD